METSRAARYHPRVAYLIDPRQNAFPPPEAADPSGLLAIGGDMSAERMLSAYASGIFPWDEYRGQPLWYSPDPRFVLEPKAIHVRRSLAKIIRRGDYTVRLDTAFDEVLAGCAHAHRPGQLGTWIRPRYARAMRELHALGVAHSAEAWRGDELVGGVYGLSLGSIFFGESMFARASDASKVAFVTLVRQLDAWGFTLVDCQAETEHLGTFGAEHWPRPRFLATLAEGLGTPTRLGPWELTIGDVTG